MTKGKKKKDDKSKRIKKISSGNKYLAKCRRQLMRLEMKIQRWENNQANPKKEKAGKSRNGWDTSGLEKHHAFLTKQIAKGKRKKRL
jgi:hypothetical protein